MTLTLSGLRRMAAPLIEAFPEPSPPNPFGRYRDDPAGFARDVLKVEWTPKQVEIAEALQRPPYRVLVKASHTVGKTHLAAGVVLHWHLTRSPSLVLTTAPKLQQVRDLLWKEIRKQGRRLVRFAGPAAVRIDRAADDFALGTTAKSGTAFQGHHGPSMLFVFDEAVGVEPEFWEVTETMFCPPGHAWLCIFNPTDSSSAAYRAESARGADGLPSWTIITMSALDHPNIAAEREGLPPPVPSAIRLGRLADMLAEWCEPVTSDPDPTSDVEWPPKSGRWLRPGPLAEARLLGRWPSQASGVWSDALWRAACRELALDPFALLALGCDVARFGDDYTAIHVRLGGVSLHHERHNGWSTTQTAGRLKELAREWAGKVSEMRRQVEPGREPLDPKKVPVNVDDDGVGGGVVDQTGGYNFVPVSAGAVANAPDDYPNRRSELWFGTAQRTRLGRLSVARLPQDVQGRLRQQLMAPVYKLDAPGRRVVEPKAETKEKLGVSPDDADAFNLAYYEAPLSVIGVHEPPPSPRQGGHFGRGRR